MSVKERVEELVKPILEHLGYELVEVTYQKQHDAMHLTIYIDCDKDGGVTLDDTEIVANALYAPVAGSKKHVGKLLSYENGILSLETKSGELQIEIKSIAVAKPYITF